MPAETTQGNRTQPPIASNALPGANAHHRRGVYPQRAGERIRLSMGPRRVECVLRARVHDDPERHAVRQRLYVKRHGRSLLVPRARRVRNPEIDRFPGREIIRAVCAVVRAVAQHDPLMRRAGLHGGLRRHVISKNSADVRPVRRRLPFATDPAIRDARDGGWERGKARTRRCRGVLGLDCRLYGVAVRREVCQLGCNAHDATPPLIAASAASSPTRAIMSSAWNTPGATSVKR